MTDMLEVRGLVLHAPFGHLWWRRQKPVLREVSFHVKAGSATAYLGPNGAGKTSTFRVLCGLCRPGAGEVVFQGRRIDGGIPSRHYGFMPEQPYFYKRLTPREFLTGMAALSGMDKRIVKDAIHDWAMKLNFFHVLDQPLHRCSKGQTQRVGIAQAMIHSPDLVILDEPLSGLDPVGRERVKRVLQEALAGGTTILFSSHILSDAEDICDEVIVLNRGRVVFQGAAEQLKGGGDAWLVEYIGPPPPEKWRTAAERRASGWKIACDGAIMKNEVLRWIVGNEDCELTKVEQGTVDLEAAFVHLLEQEGEA